MSKRKSAAVNYDLFDLSLKGHGPLKPRTETQAVYLRALANNDMTIAVGPAGSGKTYCASAWAAEQLAAGRKVILTRPTCTIDDEQIGFLPGSLEAKMEPWTAPVFDVFRERIGHQLLVDKIRSKSIEVVPFAFMRGRTFKDAVVIVDEAQNMTKAQAKAVVTRIGENCTYVINGDFTQTDRRGDDNGLTMLIQMVVDHDLPIPVVEFKSGDVVRSRLCKLWVKAFEA